MFRKTFILAMLFAILGSSAEAWGQANYSGTFTRITSADDFATGYYVVTGAGTTKALGNTANSNKRIEGVNVTINENSITNPSNSVVYYITRTENTCTFQNVGNSKYMYQASTTSGKGMGFRDNFANITFEGWTSGGTGTSAYEGFAFTLDGASNNKLKYNKSSAWFANYANDYSNTMLPVDLYKLATNSPTCTINPTSHDFDEITVGENATFDFTVTTANLTEDLTLAVSEGFSVSPATIESTETETTVTVTCTPTAVGALDGTLTISGGGLTENVTATLTATGVCTAPEHPLAYTSPVELQLVSGEAETTLAPITDTGNGGAITYELVEGDENHIILDKNTGEIITDAIGSYTVIATQAVNGAICGGTFDIVINVTSTSPSCSVSPSEWNFGNVAIGTPASKTFTVTTANLTSDLTLSMLYETYFSVSPATIEQNATETEITVTCTATTAGELEDILTISGGGLEPEVEVSLSATGVETYTINYMVNGVNTNPQVVVPETPLVFPEVTAPDADHVFCGWVTTAIEGTQPTAPEYVNTEGLTATQDITYYAVFAEKEEGEATWTEITSEPETGTYAILTASYFMKAEISNSRFANGSATPAISNNKLTTAPAEDCIWEISKPDSYYRIKNGKNYAGGTDSKNQGALLADANSNLAKWSISYNNGFTIINYGRSISANDPNNKYLRNNTTYGWATYTSTTGAAPRLFKKIVTYTYSNYCTTIVEKVLTSIELSGEYPTEFWKGETFSHDGITVTAHYENAEDEDVTEKAEFTGYDMASAGEQTVTVSYGDKTATYNITIKTIANTEEDAYTTAQAKELIDAGKDLETAVYVKGTVSKVDSYNSQYKSITYWLDNDAFEVYSGKNLNNTDFASIDDVKVGDDVIIYGKIKKWNSTYEFDSGNYLVSHVKAATLSINDITVSLGEEISPKITSNVPEAERKITYSVASEDVVKVDEEGNLVTVAVGGPVVVTATLTADGYKEATTTFTVEVIKALTSIEIATGPTVTDYKEGDKFDPTGLVITANYNDESTEDVAYAGNEDKFTFTPSLETALTTENTSVTITYAGKEATQTITVRALYTYNITWMANGFAVTLEPATVVEGNVIGTLPTPDAANIPNGYTFMGWSENEINLTNVEPTYITAEKVPTGNMTLKAVFAIAEVSGATALNKMGAGDVLNNGDNIVIVATGDNWAKALYQETVSTSYVKSYNFTGNVNDVIADSKNYVTLNTATGGKWKLGDATNGYVYNESSNDLTVDTENSTEWTISWVNDKNKYSIKNGNRWLSCRSDLSGTNQYKFRGGGTTTTNGTVYFDLYKLTTSTTTYSNFCTTVYALSGTITQSDITANTAYYISGVTTINSAVEIAALTNDNPANLIIKDGGQLVFNNSGSSKDGNINSGVKATVEKVMDKHGSWGKDEDPKAGWYFLAAPMTDFAVTSFTYQAGNGDYDLYRWYIKKEDGTPIWYNYKHHHEEAYNEEAGTGFETYFVSGRGYLAAYQTTDLLKMQGTLNAGTEFTFAINTKGNFTLLGNPFTYELNWSDFTMNNVYKGCAFVNSTTGTIKYAVGDTTIKVGTGFMVYTEDYGAELSFTKGSGSGKSNDILALNLFASNGNGEDNTIIVIDDENGGFAKADNFNTNVPQIYTERLQTKYGIRNFSTSTKEFNVSFKAAGEGSNTIRLETIGEFDYVHLYDKLLDVDVDMLLEGSYTFEASDDDNTHRFIVRIDKGNTGIDENESENFVNVYNGEIHVSGSGEVQIFDVMGRIVHSEVINGDATISTSNIKDGVYVVRLIGNGWTKSEKIVVRR